MGRVVHRRQRQLPFGGRRTADRSHLAIRPGLLGDPIECVVSISSRETEDLPLAFGKELSPLVLDDVGVAVLHGPGYGLQAPLAGLVEVVGGAREDRWQRTCGIFGQIHIRRQANAVAHGNHHLLLDRGDLCELLFELLDLFVIGQSRLNGPAEGGAGQQGGDGLVHGSFPSRNGTAGSALSSCERAWAAPPGWQPARRWERGRCAGWCP